MKAKLLFLMLVLVCASTALAQKRPKNVVSRRVALPKAVVPAPEWDVQLCLNRKQCLRWALWGDRNNGSILLKWTKTEGLVISIRQGGAGHNVTIFPSGALAETFTQEQNEPAIGTTAIVPIVKQIAKGKDLLHEAWVQEALAKYPYQESPGLANLRTP